jgi:hypothetical protein
MNAPVTNVPVTNDRAKIANATVAPQKYGSIPLPASPMKPADQTMRA